MKRLTLFNFLLVISMFYCKVEQSQNICDPNSGNFFKSNFIRVLLGDKTSTCGMNWPPSFNGLVSISHVTLSQVSLSWQKATDDTTPTESINYDICQSTTQFECRDNFATSHTVTGVDAYTITGLNTYQDYYFVVRARDGQGNKELNTNEKGVAVVTKFLYVVNGIASGTVSQFSIDKTSGSLTAMSPASVSGGNIPAGLAVDHSGKYLYVANSSGGNILMFPINTTTGLLSSPTTFTSPLINSPTEVQVHPSGKYLYCANMGGGNINGFLINQSNGSLLDILATVSAINIISLNFTPNGNFGYSGVNSTTTIKAFSVNQNTAALTGLGTAGNTGNRTDIVRVHPSGKFVYVADFPISAVYLFTINQTTGMPSIVTSYSTGGPVSSIAFDPLGKFLFAGNNTSNTIAKFTVDQSSGALTPIGSGTASIDVKSITVDATGKFLFAVNTSGFVSAFSINQTTGELTLIGSPLPAGLTPNYLSSVSYRVQK